MTDLNEIAEMVRAKEGYGEPWDVSVFAVAIDRAGAWQFWYTIDDDGVHTPYGVRERIVACVNALAGLSNAEVARLPELWQEMRLDEDAPEDVYAKAVRKLARQCGIVRDEP